MMRYLKEMASQFVWYTEEEIKYLKKSWFVVGFFTGGIASAFTLWLLALFSGL